MKSLVIASILAALSGGCAYTTATPVSNGDRSTKGIPFFAPKALVVVNGSGTSSLIVPDCSKEYRLQIGSVFAKNHGIAEFTNGMMTKIDTEQDSTALPLELVTVADKLLNPLDAAGDAMSKSVDGGVQDRYGVYEIDCSGGQLGVIRKSTIDVENLPVVPSARRATVSSLPVARPTDGATPLPQPQ